METNKLYNKFESLPMEAQKQVLLFIDSLQQKYKTKKNKNLLNKKIINSKFVGIWKDREDIKDSNLWVRNLRKKEWEKITE